MDNFRSFNYFSLKRSLPGKRNALWLVIPSESSRWQQIVRNSTGSARQQMFARLSDFTFNARLCQMGELMLPQLVFLPARRRPGDGQSVPMVLEVSRAWRCLIYVPSHAAPAQLLLNLGSRDLCKQRGDTWWCWWREAARGNSWPHSLALWSRRLIGDFKSTSRLSVFRFLLVIVFLLDVSDLCEPSIWWRPTSRRWDPQDAQSPRSKRHSDASRACSVRLIYDLFYMRLFTGSWNLFAFPAPNLLLLLLLHHHQHHTAPTN